MAQRRDRNCHRVVDHTQFQPHIDKLAWKQRQLVVWKTCLGPDSSGLHINLVVERSKHAGVQRIGPGSVQRGDFH